MIRFLLALLLVVPLFGASTNYPSLLGVPLVPQIPSMIDGTDCTTALQNAITAAPSGGKLTLNIPGTYTISTVTIAKQLSLELGKGVILKHKANATADMLYFTVSPISISGGIFDGNAANQNNNASNWWSVINIAPSATNWAVTRIERIVATNFVFAGVRFYQFNGEAEVDHSTFANGKEHGGTLGLQTEGIHFSQTTLQGARPVFNFHHNKFIQDAVPSVTGKSPGGIIIAGLDTVDSFPRGSISYNYFHRIGQVFVGNNIGSVDLYEDLDMVQVTDNTFDDVYYIAIKAQNGSKYIISRNHISGPTTGILYDPHQRTDTNQVHEVAIISANTITNAATGIQVAGNIGLGRSVTISDNWIEGSSTSGIDIGANGALVGFEGPVLIQGNTVKGGSGTACNVTLTSKEIRVIGNHFSGAVGFLATTGVNAAEFYFTGNYMEATSAGSRALIIRGASKVYCYSGVYNNTTGAGGQCINFQQDAAVNLIGQLYFPASENQVRQGITTIVTADISKWIGPITGTGSPEAVYAADIGTVYIRTGSGLAQYYVKSTGTGNTGWVMVPASRVNAISSGTLTTDSGTRYVTCDTASGNETVTLLASPETGQQLIVVKTTSDANTVTINGNGKNINGSATKVLTTQYQSSNIQYNGTAWFDVLSFPNANANWVGSGTTNSTLPGVASVNGVTVTNVASVQGMLDFGTPSTLTIASDAITITKSFHLIDTEAAATTDNLSTINGTTATRVLILKPFSGSRMFVLKHNIGNIWCAGQHDITIGNSGSTEAAILIYNSNTSQWEAALLFAGQFDILNSQNIYGTITSKNADYTATLLDYAILVDASGANRTISLPAASTVNNRIYVIKKVDSSANSVTIDPNGAELIDGAATKSTTTQWTAFTVHCNGSAWYIE